MMSLVSNTQENTQTSPYIVLVLQGGGALGAYHIGAFQALCEAGFTPQWVSGVSIGAINAAIIAGNRPDQQLQRLEELWQDISRPSFWDDMVPSSLRRFYHAASSMQALLWGQPNFSRPFFVNPYLAPSGSSAAQSFYDNTPLITTLQRFVNFDLINTAATRLTLGVTKVRTGNILFFDNTNSAHVPIDAHHVIASSSIPPMFPGTIVQGEMYWDGGIVDNTPLEPVLADQDVHPQRDTLVFMVDLWDGQGPEPQTLDDVLWRQNQIQFASRTERHIHHLMERENLRRMMHFMAHYVPQRMLSTMPVFQEGTNFTYGNLDIVRVTYHPRADQTALSYVDFSRSSIAERRADGYADMTFALGQAPWTQQRQQKAQEQAAASFAPDAPPTMMPPLATVHHVQRGAVQSHVPGNK